MRRSHHTWNVEITSPALETSLVSEATRNRECSSITVKISTPSPSARSQWVTSACQRSLGICASNRTNDDLGRYWAGG